MARSKKRIPRNGKSQSKSSGKHYDSASDKVPVQGGNKDESAAEDKDAGKDTSNSEPPKYNDPEWYSKDLDLVQNTCQVSWAQPLGERARVLNGPVYYDGGVVQTEESGQYYQIPGIITLKTKASFGYSKYMKDPLNISAQTLYTHVRNKISGSRTYDPADYELYCLSLADCYAYINWLTRIYNKAYLYSQRNKYVGKALLQTEGINPDSILANLSNFRYFINVYINKISSFALPADISYYQRRAWEYFHVYLENPDANIKDQLYQFSPDGFYRFDYDETGAGMLLYASLGNIVSDVHNMSYADLLHIGDWLLENVYGNQDFGTMSGDTVRAFEGRVIGLIPIPEIGDLTPVYSEYVLLQMKCATVVDVFRAGGDHGVGSPVEKIQSVSGSDMYQYPGNIYQDKDGLLRFVEACPGDFQDTMAMAMRATLNVSTPDPSAVDVMEITRLISKQKDLVPTGDPSDPEYYNILATGSDVVTGYSVFKFDAEHQGTLLRYDVTLIVDNITDMDAYDVANLIAFKYAPLHYLYTLDSTGGVVRDVEVASLLDNFTVVDSDVIEHIHEVALMSLLTVPGVARIVN